MDLELIKKVIKIAEESDISALTVEQNGLKVEVKRERGVMIPMTTSIGPAQPYAPLPAPPEPVTPPPAAENPDAGLIPIVSPMVGTFYPAPSPEAAPFVEIGDRVEAGKVVCIIEAMKLFNEIEAEASGTVAKVLVESGHPVEYGQKLFLIKRD